MNSDSPEPDVKQRVEEVLGEYLLRIDQGERINREELICRHPEIADELRAYFADSRAVKRMLWQSESDTDSESKDTSAVEPEVLGNYSILQRIGQGGMGQVYRARHQRMKRIVALKILPKEMANSPDAIKRFQREVEVAAKLSHSNVVAAYDADETGGVHFLVMEYVDGSDLARLVRERGPLPSAEALNYIIQAARGLEYAHAQGVVHRDIKPSNLLVDRQGTVKVLDMGLARLSREVESGSATSSLTQVGVVMGTLDFMSPEQADDTGQADVRSDIYSLGCTLFYLLEGQPVYRRASVATKVMAHREAPVPSLKALGQHVSDDLDGVFRRMVAKAPEERYQSMSEVIAALERCPELPSRLAGGREDGYTSATHKETEEERPRTSADASPRPSRSFSRGTLVGAGLLGLGLMAAILSVVFRFQSPEGTLIIEVNQADAQVDVDDGKFTLSTPDSAEPVEIQVEPGTHTLRVTKGGFRTFTKEFVVQSGSEEAIRVRLEPLGDKTHAAAGPSPPSTAVPQGTNHALQFDGTSDHVDVPALQYEGADPITIEVVVAPFDAKESIQSIAGDFHAAGLGVSLDKDGWGFGVDDGQEQGSRSCCVNSDNPPEMGKLTHIAGVFDPPHLKLFVDGELQQRAIPWGGRNAPGAFPLMIGADPNDAGEPQRFFEGVVDQVRISRVARYKEDFQVEDVLKPDEHTLALYHFDEGAGDVLHDSSGNGHHGKIFGANWVRVDERLQLVRPISSAAELAGSPSLAIAPFNPEEAGQHQEAWAGHLGVPIEFQNSIGMKFALVPPGEFDMGTSEDECRSILELGRRGFAPEYLTLISSQVPKHRVRISRPLYWGVHEVTQSQYRELTGANPSSHTASGERADFILDEDTKDYPVEMVSWHDAVAFCRKLSDLPSEQEQGVRRIYRLPTEAEWEYACRAGTATYFHSGEERGALSRAAWWGGNSGDATHGVGQKEANSWGLYDMHGNVAEWCSDWFGPYHPMPAQDPTGPLGGTQRVARGNAWGALFFLHLSSADRQGYAPDGLNQAVGFRVVCEARRVEGKAAVPEAGQGNRSPGASRKELGMGHDASAVAEFGPDGSLLKATTRWNSLLPIVDPERDAVLGDWQLQDGKLLMAEAAELCKRIEIPVIPEGSYEVRVEFARTEGDGEVALILPLQSGGATLLIRSAEQGLSVLESVREEFVSGREAIRSAPFANNERHVVVATVQLQSDRAEVRVTFDNELLLDWSGPQSAVAAQDRYAIPHHEALGIGGRSNVAFHAVELRMLEGRARQYSSPRDEWDDVAATIRSRGGTVTVNEQGQVVGCDLGGAVRIRDRELARLSGLTDLRFLRLASNWAISDKGMVHLARMHNLQDLDLSFTFVGNKGLGHIAELQGLRRLELHCTRVSDAGLPLLKPLQNLEVLSVGWASVTNEGLVHVAELKALKQLSLAFFDLQDSGAEHLARLNNLESLEILGAHRLTDRGLDRLTLLGKMRKLRLGGTNITGSGLQSLAKFPSLEILGLDGCRGIEDDDLEHLAGLELTDLSLDATPITSAGLKHLLPMQGLRVLRLAQTPVDDAAVEHLMQFKELQALDLTGTSFSAARIAELRAAMPSCRISVDPAIESELKPDGAE